MITMGVYPVVVEYVLNKIIENTKRRKIYRVKLGTEDLKYGCTV